MGANTRLRDTTSPEPGREANDLYLDLLDGKWVFKTRAGARHHKASLSINKEMIIYIVPVIFDVISMVNKRAKV